MNLSLRLGRARRIGHRRQHAVVDDDRLGRVARLRQRLGDDDRNVVADIADLALGERRMRTGPHRRAVLVVNHPAADQPADLVGGEVVAGEDPQHTRHRSSGLGVDLFQRGVGMRRAQEIGVGLARPVDVVGVAALAGDEAVVFLAADGSADSGGGHGFLLAVEQDQREKPVPTFSHPALAWRLLAGAISMFRGSHRALSPRTARDYRSLTRRPGAAPRGP